MEKYTPSWWVIGISFLLKILTIIFVPVIVVSIVQDKSFWDVFMLLIKRLSELL